MTITHCVAIMTFFIPLKPMNNYPSQKNHMPINYFANALLLYIYILIFISEIVSIIYIHIYSVCECFCS